MTMKPHSLGFIGNDEELMVIDEDEEDIDLSDDNLEEDEFDEDCELDEGYLCEEEEYINEDI